MKAGGPTGVILVALATNLGLAAAKLAAAAVTGSSAMLATAIQTLAGAGNQMLMLLGFQRARQPPDAVHPFGYAREIHFWSFAGAILLFALGAGVALYEGIDKLLHPRSVTDHAIAYTVLAVAFVLKGLSAANTIRAVKRRRADVPAPAPLRASRIPALFTVLVEDIAALIGLAIALIGIAISDLTGRPIADGYAAILIGLLLGAVAALMSVETRSVIVGESAPPELRRDIQEAIVAEVGPDRPIRAVNEIRTLRLGPRDFLVVASVDFEDGETAAAIAAATSRIEATIRTHTPSVRRIFIEGQSARDHASADQTLASSRPPAAPQPASPATLATPVAAAPIPPSAPARDDAPASSEPAPPLSRKGRKRQKHLKRH